MSDMPNVALQTLNIKDISDNTNYHKKQNNSNSFVVDLLSSNIHFDLKNNSNSPTKNSNSSSNINIQGLESCEGLSNIDGEKKESISSLNNLDLNSVLSSINFAEQKEVEQNKYSNDSNLSHLSQFDSMSSVKNFQTNQIPGFATLNSGFNISKNNTSSLDESLSLDFLNSLPSKIRYQDGKEVTTYDNNNFTNRSIDFVSFDKKVTMHTNNKLKIFDIDLFSFKTEIEDVFDQNLIKRQLRGVIIVIYFNLGKRNFIT
jgi:hypothetical protein